MVVNPSIEALEQQVKELQSKMGTSVQNKSEKIVPQIGKEDIKTIVQSILDEYGLIPGLNSREQKVVPLMGENVVPNKQYSLLEAIGLALSKEDQIWASSEKVLFELPNYIVTKNGQDIIRDLFTQFREFYENKECSDIKK
jgi:hypothetical protein